MIERDGNGKTNDSMSSSDQPAHESRRFRRPSYANMERDAYLARGGKRSNRKVEKGALC